MVKKLDTNKRITVSRDKSIIFAVVSIAAIITTSSLVVSKNLFSQGNYYGRVADKKQQALEQLQQNKESVASLQQAYDAFTAQQTNLLGGSSTGKGERDGENARLLLDALPSRYDFPALAASVEKMLEGINIESISGVDDLVAQQTNTAAGVVEMPFSLEAVLSFNNFVSLLDKFDRSIRPFQLNRLEISGSNSKLQARFDAKTYYQPAKGVEIIPEDVQ